MEDWAESSSLASVLHQTVGGENLQNTPMPKSNRVSAEFSYSRVSDRMIKPGGTGGIYREEIPSSSSVVVAVKPSKVQGTFIVHVVFAF
ncbi:hypothetical protein PIB30_081881, partial [Stylosanthes scabra]|nr:hypothetical protein [Stylosanthes scabra]